MSIEFNADAALAKLEALVAQHGPQAVDTAAEVVRVGAIGDLIVGAGCAVATALIWRTLHRVSTTRWKETDVFDDPMGPFPMIALLAAGFLSCVTTIGALEGLLDVWNWVALFNPKLALAHQILSRVVS